MPKHSPELVCQAHKCEEPVDPLEGQKALVRTSTTLTTITSKISNGDFSSPKGCNKSAYPTAAPSVSVNSRGSLSWRRHSYRWFALVVEAVEVEGSSDPVVVQRWVPGSMLRPVRADLNRLYGQGWI